jgi:hypothetical protein
MQGGSQTGQLQTDPRPARSRFEMKRGCHDVGWLTVALSRSSNFPVAGVSLPVPEYITPLHAGGGHGR